MNRKLERDALLADLAAVKEILASLPSNDPLGRISFNSRQTQIEQALAELEQLPDTLASVALLFNGDPVVGSRAIDAEFAARAIERYQEIIAKKLASNETGGLAQRGPIPSRKASRLNITNVVHGSFGFILEEDSSGGPQLLNSSLREAADDVTKILDRFSGLQDDAYDSTVEDIDERLFGAIRQFFKILHEDGATLRVVEGQQDKRFDWNAIERAYRRVEETKIGQSDFSAEGILIGVVPIGRRFELRIGDEEGIIAGKIGPSFSQDYLERIDKHEEVVGKKWKATIRKKIVERPGRPTSTTYTLLKLDEPRG